MDKIYGPLLINLDKRADRLEESRIEFEKLNLDYRRISASNRPEDGALGCLESHCICLEQFLSTDQDVVMICEDDISFNCHRDELDKYVNMFLQDQAGALCLGFLARSWEPYSDTFRRSRHLQTTVCYLVKRSTAVKLLTLWKRMVELIVSNGRNTDNWYSREFNALPGRGIVWDIYPADQSWKLIQKDDIFLIPNKHVVTQRASHSDIEHKRVDYKL
jgi:GR25 family glycosyltransferase involved in LPS biosynthesis